MFRSRSNAPKVELPKAHCPLLVGIKTNIEEGFSFLPKKITDPTSGVRGSGNTRVSWNAFGKLLVTIPAEATNVQIIPVIGAEYGTVEGYVVTYSKIDGMAGSIKFTKSWIHIETDQWERELEVVLYVTEVETVTR